jgi:osmotically-inducible protein OsmY
MTLFNLAALLLLGADALPRAAAKPAGLSVPRDVQLTVQVKKALGEDAELTQANLRVLVRDGVAVLNGPVPSPELLERAVKTVREVKGVLKVQNELYVAAPPQPDFVLPKPEPATRSTSASPPRDGSGPSWLTMPLPRPDVSPTVSVKDPPIVVEERRPEQTVSRPVRTEVVSPLLERVEKVRQTDRRYRPIRVDVEGAVVVVRGGAPGETLMAFMQALRQVEGVERVVLKKSN